MIFFEIAFIASSALSLYSIFPEYKWIALSLWPFVFAWGWLHWFCKTHLNLPFSIDLLRFASHAKIFSDSIYFMKIPQKIALSLPLLLLSFFLVQPFLSLWLPLCAISGLASLRFPQKAKKEPSYKWDFPTENFKPLSSDYPLLRKTYRFKGEKRLSFSFPGNPHIIFLFLESFRAKNIGCLGGDPAASPQFDALAERGMLFTRFHANGLQTFRAMISSFFGIPAHLKTVSLRPFCPIPLIGLPEILQANGYHTALIQAGYTVFDWTFPFLRKHGFETILGREDFTFVQNTSWGIPDETLLYFAAEWLQRQHRPTFLSLFTITNHHPWESPKEFPIPKHLSEAYRRFLQTFSYTDYCLGQFVEKLEQANLLEKSVLFIMGDHGQGMGERSKGFAFHSDLYQENIHIPLLILGKENMRIDEPASQVDLLPTVLDLLNLPAIHHSVGRSLLRKGNAPVFFSMLQTESKLGCIEKEGKFLLGKKEEFYLLPDEQNSLPAPEELKQKTRSYFQSIEILYDRRAWAPPSLDKTFALQVPPNATDAEWSALIGKTSPSIIDLSKSRLTDRAIQAIGNKAANLQEIHLSNSPFFTDHSLEWIATHCPHLSMFYASHCPLITARGVNAILNRCPFLRSLHLEGNDEIADLFVQNQNFLHELHLKDCSHFSGDALVHLARQCPYLDYLSASFAQVEDRHVREMALHLKRLLCLQLENGIFITDAAFQTLLAANPNLAILVIENFPHLKEIDFSQKKGLDTLKFIHCPNLSDATLELLRELPIQYLEVVSCPNITSKSLKKMHPRCRTFVR